MYRTGVQSDRVVDRLADGKVTLVVRFKYGEPSRAVKSAERRNGINVQVIRQLGVSAPNGQYSVNGIFPFRSTNGKAAVEQN